MTQHYQNCAECLWDVTSGRRAVEVKRCDLKEKRWRPWYLWFILILYSITKFPFKPQYFWMPSLRQWAPLLGESMYMSKFSGNYHRRVLNIIASQLYYIPAKFGVYSVADGDSNRVSFQSILSVQLAPTFRKHVVLPSSELSRVLASELRSYPVGTSNVFRIQETFTVNRYFTL